MSDTTKKICALLIGAMLTGAWVFVFLLLADIYIQRTAQHHSWVRPGTANAFIVPNSRRSNALSLSTIYGRRSASVTAGAKRRLPKLRSRDKRGLIPAAFHHLRRFSNSAKQ